MKYSVGMFTFLLMLLLLPPSFAAVQQDCTGCHQTTVATGDTRIYLHSPFAQRLCGACHTAEEKPPAVSVQQPAEEPFSKATPEKVSWLADSNFAATTHSFLLPAEELGEFLVVEKKREGGGLSRNKIAVPGLGSVEEVKDDGQLPAISDVRVLKVQRGVFLSVTIGWRTESLSRPLVRYGDSTLTQRSEPSLRYGHEHQVTLYNLKPDKTYTFTVTSIDLFGREKNSDGHSFSTKKSLNDVRVEVVTDPVIQADDLRLESRFRRLGANYLVELRAPEAFLAFIGSAGQVREGQLVPRSASDSTGGGGQHPKLSSDLFRSVQSCQKCHGHQKALTHPVNVHPKPGMIIPPEYPTLPDGRITCATCHMTHGSDNEYLAIRPGKRELCVGCHKDLL